jgi:hypothetical protein
MSMLSVEMTKHVEIVYDSGFKDGVAKGKRELSFILESIAANQENQKLSDSEFREFVGRLVSEFRPERAA